MKKIFIVKTQRYYTDLFRQTPNNHGIWGNYQFYLENPGKCDYVIIFNRVPDTVHVSCPPENVWVLIQEPPVAHRKYLHWGIASASKVFTNNPNLTGERYVREHPALPWLVNKTYDELNKEEIPSKKHTLSWITSNLRVLKGHQARMTFLDTLRQHSIEFDLFGRGFNPIADKWSGLAPYKYSIVIENHSNAYYWSEKIADCLLAWTLPIYFGCTRIGDYFPKGSFIYVDIYDPQAPRKILQIINSDMWEQNITAIEEARNRILNHYQFFPFISSYIKEHEKNYKALTTSHEFLEITNDMRPLDKLHSIFSGAHFQKLIRKYKLDRRSTERREKRC